MSTPNLDAFISWFEHNNGYIDTQHVGFHVFPSSEGGRGAVALQDIPVWSIALHNSSWLIFFYAGRSYVVHNTEIASGISTNITPA